jgi:hypothetical protein
MKLLTSLLRNLSYSEREHIPVTNKVCGNQKVMESRNNETSKVDAPAIMHTTKDHSQRLCIARG